MIFIHFYDICYLLKLKCAALAGKQYLNLLSERVCSVQQCNICQPHVFLKSAWHCPVFRYGCSTCCNCRLCAAGCTCSVARTLQSSGRTCAVDHWPDKVGNSRYLAKPSNGNIKGKVKTFY